MVFFLFRVILIVCVVLLGAGCVPPPNPNIVDRYGVGISTEGSGVSSMTAEVKGSFLVGTWKTGIVSSVGEGWSSFYTFLSDGTFIATGQPGIVYRGSYEFEQVDVSTAILHLIYLSGDLSGNEDKTLRLIDQNRFVMDGVGIFEKSLTSKK